MSQLLTLVQKLTLSTSSFQLKKHYKLHSKPEKHLINNATCIILQHTIKHKTYE